MQVITAPDIIQESNDFSHIGKIGSIIGDLVAKYPELRLVDKQNAYDENLSKQISDTGKQWVKDAVMDENFMAEFQKNTGLSRDEAVKRIVSHMSDFDYRPGDKPDQQKIRASQAAYNIYSMAPNSTKVMVKAMSEGIGTDEANRRIKENMKKEAINQFIQNDKSKKYDISKKEDGTLQDIGDAAIYQDLNDLGLDESFAPVKDVLEKRKATMAAMARDSVYEDMQKNFEDPKFDSLPIYDQYATVIKGGGKNIDENDKANIMELLKQRQAAKQFAEKLAVDKMNAGTARKKALAEIGKMNSDQKYEIYKGAVTMSGTIERVLATLQQRKNDLVKNDGSAADIAAVEGQIASAMSQLDKYTSVISAYTEGETGISTVTPPRATVVAGKGAQQTGEDLPGTVSGRFSGNLLDVFTGGSYTDAQNALVGKVKGVGGSVKQFPGISGTLFVYDGDNPAAIYTKDGEKLVKMDADLASAANAIDQSALDMGQQLSPDQRAMAIYKYVTGK